MSALGDIARVWALGVACACGLLAVLAIFSLGLLAAGHLLWEWRTERRWERARREAALGTTDDAATRRGG